MATLSAPALATRPMDLEVLARSPILGQLSDAELGALAERLEEVTVARGTYVFREEEAADALYFVLEGEARLRRGQLELRRLRPGDHFGELALFAPGPSAGSVEARTALRLGRLAPERYRALARTRPTLALRVAQAVALSLGEQLTELTDSVGLLAYQRSVPRRLRVRVRRGTDELVVATGTLAGEVLPPEVDGALVVGAKVNDKAASLETALAFDVDLDVITIDSPEGRSIFGRSAALLLLEAARVIAPEVPLRMGQMLLNGQIVLIDPSVDRVALARDLQRAIEGLVRDNLPLREEVWAVDEARTHLAERGAEDAAALLASRREPTVNLLMAGGTYALALGSVVPRASYLGDLSVVPHPAGAMLRFGERIDATMPGVHGRRVDPARDDVETPRFFGEMARSAQEWLEGLGVTSVGRYNAFCVSARVPELVRVAEGFHEKWIGRIADQIASRSGVVKIIVIAGPSSSGKTTFIKRLTTQLLVDGARPIELSLDDYYVDRDKTARDASGEYDFEAFEALDTKLFQGHVSRLLRGERVATAKFDFRTGLSSPSGGKELALGRDDVLLVEGIHAMNPRLFAGALQPERVFRIFVQPATALPFDRLSVLAPDDVRLVRRLVRDRHHRNYTAAETIVRWPRVRNGELCHIFPYLPNADVVFDSALVYEMSVLKTYAERYLLEVPEAHPAFATASRLRLLIDQFVAIYAEHVPPTSVLREFVGGSGFEY